MSFLRRICSKSSLRFRSYGSCNYSSYDKPTFSPFFASLLVGSFFNFMILSRMNSELNYHYQEYETLKREIKDVKQKLDKLK